MTKTPTLTNLQSLHFERKFNARQVGGNFLLCFGRKIHSKTVFFTQNRLKQLFYKSCPFSHEFELSCDLPSCFVVIYLVCLLYGHKLVITAKLAGKFLATKSQEITTQTSIFSYKSWEENSNLILLQL